MLEILLHIIIVLFAPPLFLGIINKTKAWCAGRRGPPITQLYFDLAKLARKSVVISQTTSWIFIAGPFVGLITVLAATLVVPIGSAAAPVNFPGDFLLFIYLLALGRFFTVSAALDTGSAFEGMGAAREVTFAALAEPALLCSFLGLAKLSSSLSLSGMLGNVSTASASTSSHPTALPVLILVAVSLLVVLLVESCRIPFDDPNTHLELTMIHEVLVLDHSGPLLGVILYTASVKLFLMSALLIGVLTPSSLRGGLTGPLLLLLGVLAVSVGIGLLESNMARLRLTSVPRLLVGSFIISMLAVALVLR